MKEIIQYTSGSLNPKNIIDTLVFKSRFAVDNPEYFYPAGIWVFCGPQGSGKTLSAVQTLKAMCKDYPKALVCSNIEIKGLDREVIPFTDYSQLEQLNNGINGIIFFLDEIHVLWNSLESKEIPISEMACFCQMRKNRRVILGTSQIYGRIAKPIREQLQYVVDCKNFGGLIQYNTILDPVESVEHNGIIESQVIKHKIWFHSPKLYGAYDTLFKITKAERKAQKQEVKKHGRNSNKPVHGNSDDCVTCSDSV